MKNIDLKKNQRILWMSYRTVIVIVVDNEHAVRLPGTPESTVLAPCLVLFIDIAGIMCLVTTHF
jgi:hypothetical protein